MVHHFNGIDNDLQLTSSLAFLLFFNAAGVNISVHSTSLTFNQSQNSLDERIFKDHLVPAPAPLEECGKTTDSKKKDTPKIIMEELLLLPLPLSPLPPPQHRLFLKQDKNLDNDEQFQYKDEAFAV